MPPTEHEAVTDGRIFDHERRISNLEAWREAEAQQQSRVPAWVTIAIMVTTFFLSTLINLYLSGTHP